MKISPASSGRYPCCGASSQRRDSRYHSIVEQFGEDILAAGMQNGSQVVYVKPERLLEFAEFVRSDESCTTRR